MLIALLSVICMKENTSSGGFSVLHWLILTSLSPPSTGFFALKPFPPISALWCSSHCEAFPFSLEGPSPPPSTLCLPAALKLFTLSLLFSCLFWIPLKPSFPESHQLLHDAGGGADMPSAVVKWLSRRIKKEKEKQSEAEADGVRWNVCLFPRVNTPTVLTRKLPMWCRWTQSCTQRDACDQLPGAQGDSSITPPHAAHGPHHPHYDPELSETASLEEVARDVAVPHSVSVWSHWEGRVTLPQTKEEIEVYLLKIFFPITSHRGPLLWAEGLPTAHPYSFLFQDSGWYFSSISEDFPQLPGEGTCSPIPSLWMPALYPRGYLVWSNSLQTTAPCSPGRAHTRLHWALPARRGTDIPLCSVSRGHCWVSCTGYPWADSDIQWESWPWQGRGASPLGDPRWAGWPRRTGRGFIRRRAQRLLWFLLQFQVSPRGSLRKTLPPAASENQHLHLSVTKQC